MCIAHICQCVLHIFAKIRQMQFGKFFKECRKQKGLSQKQVAELLGIYQSNISDWENDISRPSYENLIDLAEIYEVSIYDLLGVEEKIFR